MNTSLAISGTQIHQDKNQRYNLVDLHKASGNEQRHRPKYWIASDQTKELISAINNENSKGENSPFKQIQPLVVVKGAPSTGGGTFAVKELVYAYATWVRPEFHLAVIRAYDALVNKPSNTCTVEQRKPLVTAIRNLVLTAQSRNFDLKFDQAHSIVNLKLGISCIEDITQQQLPEGLAIVGQLLEDVIFKSGRAALAVAVNNIQPEVLCSYELNVINGIIRSNGKGQIWTRACWAGLRRVCGLNSSNEPFLKAHRPLIVKELARQAYGARIIQDIENDARDKIMRQVFRSGDIELVEIQAFYESLTLNAAQKFNIDEQEKAYMKALKSVELNYKTK
jgi:hypothetical protein